MKVLTYTNKTGIAASAIGAINSLYYKIGRFGKVFYFDGLQWVLSTTYGDNADELESALDSMRDRFSLADDSVKKGK